MDNKKLLSFTVIALIVGFMLAIQFQTVKEPAVRDTRDTWQLREDLLKEKEIQSRLIREISSNEEKLAQYETERSQSKEQVLRTTLDELKLEAGITDVSGPGIVLTIEPVYEEIVLGELASDISPELLKRLVNELNMYDAKYISIDGQRIINTTVIRDINRETKIDGYPLNSMPIEVKVIVANSETAEKLFNRMQVSKSADDFFIDNLRMTVSSPVESLTIPAYQDSIRVRNMEPLDPGKGGD
ncbi:NgoFVII family restriction endonuclease [Bacillus canaveralius]|uniref:NgoFVII family restriction endonuclease n=1 Tax=Bacillus canaveralius TaxID=1403243 RepID=A0A2N5GNN9_9BACI|nr:MULTISPECIES: DUF881 domain-containing protein [Bacillus]PLR80967.1 NgoFVII family restriction endonuclease [Bacillus sp. V33-4]PLR84123.1 NgoFVII family restriction endonuclease [Bacillus canaveralius]PLR96231.1 NgoFVII family restriction endonuclease [Bacillus canaveralius]